MTEAQAAAMIDLLAEIAGGVEHLVIVGQAAAFGIGWIAGTLALGVCVYAVSKRSIL